MNIGSRSEAGKTKAAGVDGWREKNRSGWGKKSGILFRLKYDAMFQCFEVCCFFVFCFFVVADKCYQVAFSLYAANFMATFGAGRLDIPVWIY